MDFTLKQIGLFVDVMFVGFNIAVQKQVGAWRQQENECMEESAEETYNH